MQGYYGRKQYKNYAIKWQLFVQYLADVTQSLVLFVIVCVIKPQKFIFVVF